MGIYFPQDLENYAPWVAEYGLVAPYGQCQCGCRQPVDLATRNRQDSGLKKGEPIRFAPGHQVRVQPKPSVEERFWSKADRQGPNDCWEWQAGRGEKGYGWFHRNGKNLGAHRMAWELTNGPIPEGLFVCHKCDNPPCVNPAHLFLHTPDGNVQDKVQKNRQTKGAKVNTTKLTPDLVREIRRKYATEKISTPALAKTYGISQAAVWEIVNRRSWKHVE